MRHLLAIALTLCGIAHGQQLRQQQLLLAQGAASGPGTWTRIQTYAQTTNGGTNPNFGCSGTSCTLSGFTLASGHVAVIMFKGDNGNGAFLTAISGGGTWTMPVGCQVTQSGWNDISCAYTLTTSSATSLTFTLAFGPGSADSDVVLREYSYSGASSAVDSGGVACATVDSTSSTHTGITPTLAGNDIVTQSIATTSTNVTAVTIYGNIQANAIFFNFGEAVLENTSNTSPPVWTTGAAPAIRCSLAVKGL